MKTTFILLALVNQHISFIFKTIFKTLELFSYIIYTWQQWFLITYACLN